MSEWEGKVALVTGGSRGIGRAVAEALASRGAKTFVTSRDEQRAKEVASEITAATGGSAVHGVAVEVSDKTSVEAGFKSVLDDAGRMDVLVNNAGITRDNLLLRLKPDDWDAVIKTNLNGLYYCSQAVLRPMIRQRSGRIINMSSVVGLMGNTGQASYAATKAAIVGFTKSLARELASRQITVNAVAPGYIDTDMTREIPEDAKEALTEAIPLQRIGRPEDVAEAVVFLASDGAGYITGQVLQVNGGLYM